MSVNTAPLLLHHDDARDVLRGLRDRPRHLPARLFYDVAGSALFEQITELPEYYLTSTEQAIFTRHAAAMMRAAGEAKTVIELGAGTARKSLLLLRAALEGQSRLSYVPVDVSPSALDVARRRVGSELPQVDVHPVVMDYTRSFAPLSALAGPRLVLFIGSSIGNFDPMPAAGLLRRLRSSLDAGDALLLGADMRKPVEVLLRAYDDSSGVTAQFNLNVLARINREFGADFDLDSFAHHARWNEQKSRIEMHLVSRCAQRVRIPALALSLDFAAEESIHTENSYKFSPAMLEAMAANAGFSLEEVWSDEQNWFTVNLLRA
jgi:dimethylhistidine N-methyltransferase